MLPSDTIKADPQEGGFKVSSISHPLGSMSEVPDFFSNKGITFYLREVTMITARAVNKNFKTGFSCLGGVVLLGNILGEHYQPRWEIFVYTMNVYA